MTVDLTINSALDVVETISAANSPLAASGGSTRRYNGASVSGTTLGAATTPAVSGSPADLSHTLSGGTTKDFDLTAVPTANDVNVTADQSTKKLVGILVRTAAGNAAAGVVLAPGPTNGYDLFGSGGQVTIYPGQSVLYTFVDAAAATPAVGASAKAIRFTGTDGDDWDAIAVFG